VDGISWGQAKIDIKSLLSSNKKDQTSLEIKNISAANTDFSYTNNKTSINTYIELLSLSSFYKKASQSPRLKELSISGNKLSVNNQPLQLKAASYLISGNSSSSILGLEVKSFKEKDSLQVSSARINFLAEINDFLKSDFHFQNLEMQSPVLKVSQRSQPSPGEPDGKKLSVTIDQLTTTEPNVDISVFQGDSAIKIFIPKSEGSFVKASGISLNDEGIKLDKISADVNAATFTKKTGEVLGVEKGKANIELSDVQLAKKNGKSSWSAQINKLQLQNPNSFALGKNIVRLYWQF
jgi:hypothetical protein